MGLTVGERNSTAQHLEAFTRSIKRDVQREDCVVDPFEHRDRGIHGGANATTDSLGAPRLVDAQMSQRPPMLPDVLSATTSSALLNLGADSIGHHSRMRAITARVGALLHPAAARSSERADSLNAALLGLGGDLP